MSDEEKRKLEALWAKCCDITQPMSDEELGELGTLLMLEEGEFEDIEA